MMDDQRYKTDMWRGVAIQLQQELDEKRADGFRLVGYGFLAGMLVMAGMVWFFVL